MWECFLKPGLRRDVPILVKMSHPSKGVGQLVKTRKVCVKVCLGYQGRGRVLSGQVHLPYMPTTEIEGWRRSPEYSGRTEYVTNVSKMKEMGLPATFKITLGSAAVMV